MRKPLFLTLLLSLILSFARADGGMWIPLFLSQNEAEMQQLGFHLTADDIYSINHNSMKDAIVLFGSGCTAELISSKGLLLTNHHCGSDRTIRRLQVDRERSVDRASDPCGYCDLQKEKRGLIPPNGEPPPPEMQGAVYMSY